MNYPTKDSPNNGGRCRLHGGTFEVGKDASDYKHGKYSDYISEDLTDNERDFLEDITGVMADGTPQEQRRLISMVASETFIKYKRGGDHRLLREFRTMVEKFNLAPNSEKHEVQYEGIESEFMNDLRNAAEEVEERTSFFSLDDEPEDLNASIEELQEKQEEAKEKKAKIDKALEEAVDEDRKREIDGNAGTIDIQVE